VNLNPLHPLTEEEAADLAGCLLASSTIDVYVRCLETASASDRLLAELRAGSVDGKDLVRWGWFFRDRLYETPLRSEWELPLALLTFVLARSGVAGVDELLQGLASSGQRQAAWIAGLSRRLLSQRAMSRIDSSPVEERLIDLSSLITNAISSESSGALPEDDDARNQSAVDQEYLPVAA
jgi:hypothetical protein